MDEDIEVAREGTRAAARDLVTHLRACAMDESAQALVTRARALIAPDAAPPRRGAAAQAQAAYQLLWAARALGAQSETVRAAIDAGIGAVERYEREHVTDWLAVVARTLIIDVRDRTPDETARAVIAALDSKVRRRIAERDSWAATEGELRRMIADYEAQLAGHTAPSAALARLLAKRGDEVRDSLIERVHRAVLRATGISIPRGPRWLPTVVALLRTDAANAEDNDDEG